MRNRRLKNKVLLLTSFISGGLCGYFLFYLVQKLVKTTIILELEGFKKGHALCAKYEILFSSYILIIPAVIYACAFYIFMKSHLKRKAETTNNEI